MKRYLYLNIFLALVIVVLVNYLANRHSARLDLTEDKVYTLSSASKDLVSKLDAPLNITVYLSKDASPGLAIFAKELTATLEDYRHASNNKIVYKITDPLKNEKALAMANADQVKPFVIQVYDKDEIKSRKAYASAVLRYKGKKQVIKYLDPDISLEYTLSSAVEKLVSPARPVVGILSGYNIPVNSMKGFLSALDERYRTEIFVFDTLTDLSRFDVIAIVSPRDLDSVFITSLNKYLISGGKLFLALNETDVSLYSQPPFGQAKMSGLEEWLEGFGLKINHDFVIDAVCGQLPVMQVGAPVQTKIDFPFFPVIKDFAKHPVTAGLSAVATSFVSSVEVSKPVDGVSVELLAYSGEHSGIVKAPVTFDFGKQWTKADFPLSHIPVGAALEGKNWKIILFADADFMLLPANDKFKNSDNIALAVNSIDWLADRSGLIRVRTKGSEFRPVKYLDANQKRFIKYFNLALPIVLVLSIAFFVSIVNRRKRRGK